MKLFLILGTLFCVVSGQDEMNAKIKSLTVISDIKVRYARTMVSAEYFNDKNSPALADFSVILPNTAYISNFTMDIGGNVTVGEVKEKQEAKEIFDDAVKRGESAGHISIRHRFTQKFDMAVNVQPNTKVVFNLTYEELLRRTQGNYTHKIFLFNGEIIDDVLVEVFISEPQDINVLEENIDQDLSVRSVDYIDNKHVYIRFNPSPEEQEELLKRGYNGIFTVEYDVERKESNAVYTLDGYFVHFFSPEDEPIWPKNVVFMIDVSGSMDGDNLRMVKGALRNILTYHYSVNDSFTFGTFSKRVTWEQSKSHEEAMRFIDSLEATGGTNLYDALRSSLEKLREGHQPNRADVLFFLTDGQPTIGVTNTAEIRSKIKGANTDNVMIYTLGFGANCDHQFLKDLSNENNGFSRKIYIDEDSAEQIQDLFQEISHLMLKDIIITYVNSSIDQTRLTTNEFKSFFKGSEIAIAGPINDRANKSHTIAAVIKGVNAQTAFEHEMNLEIKDLNLDLLNIVEDMPTNPNLTKLGHLPNITKKTWAYLTLRKMFEDAAPNEDIVAMAIKNNFVTPLTSMVVTKAKLEGQISEDEQTQSRGSRRKNGSRQGNRRRFHLGQGNRRRIGSGASSRRKIGTASRGKFDLSSATRSKIDFSQGIRRKIHSEAAGHSRVKPVQASRDYINTATALMMGFSKPPTTATPIPTATTSTRTTPTTTTTTIVTTTKITTTAAPVLSRQPAIIVKPSECDIKLCVSRKSDCFNGTKVLLLKDLRAGVEIYGYPKEISNVTCVDKLYRIILKSRRMNVEITPALVKINRKKYDVTQQPNINYTFKKFFKLTAFFDRSEQRETLSLQFILKDHLKKAKGIYGKYMKKFNCHLRPSGEMQLDQMSETFRMVSFQKIDGKGLDQCYI